jgi:hypothetical protein
MPSPCRVCMHPDRAEVDQRLASERVNLTQLSRALGVGRKALERHRDRHVPSQLTQVHAHADAEPAVPLLAELARLYDLILDALASAEAATLSHIDTHRGARPTASHAAIAEFVNDAREHVGHLTALFLDAAIAQQLAVPLEPHARAALARLVERASTLTPTI